MIRLISKELRQLTPIGCLWLAVLVLGYATQFLTERIDEQTFSGWCEGYCDYSSNTWVTVFSAMIAMVTAYSLFPREYDEATIDFLRALPVSRRTVFIAKVAAAWLLLCMINVLSYSIDALLLASNPESMGGRFYPEVWSTLLWRDCLFAFIVLSHGVLLSWFRTLGLIIYGIYLLILMWLESYLGASGNWSIFSLMANEYQGSALLPNYQGLFIHTFVAGVLLMLAYRLWSHTDSSVSGGAVSTRGMRLVHGLFAAAGFLFLGVLLSYRIGVGTGTSDAESLRVSTTEHYRFVYEAEREAVARYVIDHAEADLAALAELLGVEELPDIRVDLSARSEHAAGLAKWKKIQMDLDAFEDDISQRRVLSHETAHVLQAVESDRALSRNFSAAQFFIEGMAQYTSFEVVPEPARRRSNWQLASVSWQRQKIRFNDLIDAAGFAMDFDAELHYSLGDLWVRAMVDTCGLSVLGDFLRATGRDGAPLDLPAAIFWRDTTQAIGCDLDTVNVTWRKQMAALYEEVDISHYPEYTDITVEKDPDTNQIRISARLVASSTTSAAISPEAGLEVDSESSPESSDQGNSGDFQMPERFIVRVGGISTQLSGGDDQVFRGRLTGPEEARRVAFLVPQYAIPGASFRYALGFTAQSDARYYYERWRRGTMPSAADS